MVCHAFKHLVVEVPHRCPVLFSQNICISYSEEIVRRYTYAEHSGIVWFQCSLKQMEIVGINLYLIASDRIFPASQVTVDDFPVKVTALDEPHIHRCTACIDALMGEVEKLCLKVPSIGQVCLHYDSCLVVCKLRL